MQRDKEAMMLLYFFILYPCRKDFQTLEYNLKSAQDKLKGLRAHNDKLKTDLDHQNIIQDTVKNQNQELVGQQKKLEIKTKIYADKVHQLEEVNDDLYQKIVTMEALIE